MYCVLFIMSLSVIISQVRMLSVFPPHWYVFNHLSPTSLHPNLPTLPSAPQFIRPFRRPFRQVLVPGGVRVAARSERRPEPEPGEATDLGR